MVGPKPHAVRIVEHDPNWPILAVKESGRLAEAVGEVLLRTEHIGSTSVPNLAAKPVIDLMPIVASLADLDSHRHHLEALGYDWHGEFGIEGRRLCLLETGGVRQFHVHFYAEASPEIKKHLLFRDYLRALPERARAYEDEKRRAAALHPNNSLAYNGEKAGWLAEEMIRARTWAQKEGWAIA